MQRAVCEVTEFIVKGMLETFRCHVSSFNPFSALVSEYPLNITHLSFVDLYFLVCVVKTRGILNVPF